MSFKLCESDLILDQRRQSHSEMYIASVEPLIDLSGKRLDCLSSHDALSLFCKLGIGYVAQRR
jgi:hypothetical protein